MSPLRVFLATSIAATSALGACASAPRSPARPSEHALSGLAAQHVVVLPTYIVHVAPELGWTLPRATEVAKTLDADIASSFEEHGIRGWILPSALETSYRRNPTYATDPHALAEEPLRSPSLSPDQRLPEPIASQLRTIVALQNDARLVLAPVELRMESAGPGMGRGVLKLVLVDARQSAIQWVGEVSSDPVPAFGPAITASIASKLSATIAP